jgi:murein DD-endopeptidase MepM/ murein hydrolase activator NlpD
VDYAAAYGTPVRAVAAGTVEMAGWSNGGGNTIKLRHAGGIETSYMHLSRISVRYGAHVTQGQVIGNVGSTGIATGPHLDFRIYQRGTPVNPARFIVPPAPPIPQSAMKSFIVVRDDLRSKLDQVSLH